MHLFDLALSKVDFPYHVRSYLEVLVCFSVGGVECYPSMVATAFLGRLTLFLLCESLIEVIH